MTTTVNLVGGNWYAELESTEELSATEQAEILEIVRELAAACNDVSRSPLPSSSEVLRIVQFLSSHKEEPKRGHFYQK